jgi:hypothetical protein
MKGKSSGTFSGSPSPRPLGWNQPRISRMGTDKTRVITMFVDAPFPLRDRTVICSPRGSPADPIREAA